MELSVLNLSGIYEKVDFYKQFTNVYVDLTGVEGTNCYCDDEACSAIKNAIKHINYQAIHFIDSGNYHYMSKLWTDMIASNFNLIVFDHHTDMQEPSFGDILSCGGWIKKAIEENPYLQKVFLIGVKMELALEIPENLKDKIVCITEQELDNDIPSVLEPTSTPFYLSIDKDALSEEYAITNWDQGSLTLSQMKDYIAFFASNAKLIGVDVCGETDLENCDSKAIEINNKTNRNIVEFINEINN